MKLSFTKNKDVDSEDIANKVQTFENIVGSSLVQRLIKAATSKRFFPHFLQFTVAALINL